MTRQQTDIRDSLCQNSGECLLRLGRLAKFLLRHGSRLDQVAFELNVGRRVCSLAVAFLDAPDRLKFRAIFEDWSALRIRSRLQSLEHSLSLAAAV